MFEYLGYPYLLLVVVVVLMTGFLSLIREAAEIMWPGRDLKRTRFWNFLIIAFILSSFFLWYKEHQTVSKLITATKIDFKGTIDKVLMSPIEKDGSRHVLFFVSVENDGAPSIVKDYNAKASFDGTHEVNLMFEMIPEKGIKIRDRIFYPTHAIYENTKDPVVKGYPRYGIMLFLLRDANKFKGHAQWHLSFTDYAGKEYKMTIASTYEENVLPFQFKKVEPLFLSSPSPHFTGSAPK